VSGDRTGGDGYQSSAGLTLCVLLSVLIAAPVAGDGESNWLKGVPLLAVYLILALAFLALPGSS
jgi:Ca2+:H+ antiporter